MNKRTHWILWPSLVVLAAGGVSAKVLLAKEEVIFTVDKARRQDLRETINGNGEIQARTRVNVGTSVTAEIIQIHVKDGQWVKAGDLLVTLDQERFKQQLSQAELGLRSPETTKLPESTKDLGPAVSAPKATSEEQQ